MYLLSQPSGQVPTLTTTPTTMYPSITSRIHHLVHYINKSPLLRTKSQLALTGTVKLHGHHADIVIESNNSMRFQSRHRHTLTPTDDYHGFATHMTHLTNTILVLKAQFHARYAALNPATTPSTNVSHHPTIISGEWIGRDIQSLVAICQMERAFVIASVSINGAWVPLAHYADIEDPTTRIFNISRGGFYHETLDHNDLAATAARLQSPTDAVDIECPFAKSFGISGIGEGIVWTVDADPGNPNLWLKTRGMHFDPANYYHEKKDPAAAAAGRRSSQLQGHKDGNQRRRAGRFAEKVAHRLRMEQGVEYLREMGLAVEAANSAAFAEWVVGDVMKEERREMREEGLEEATVERLVGRLAFAWFHERLGGDAAKDGCWVS